MAEQSVTLQPGESKVVSFETIPHEARTYQVVVDDLSGSFSAIAPIPPPLDITTFLRVVNNSMLSSLPEILSWFTALQVTQLGFELSNSGGVVNGVTVKFHVGVLELSPPLNEFLGAISQPFSVAPGTRNIFFRYTFPIPGLYTVKAEIYVSGELVESLSQDVTVEPPPPPPY